MPERLYSTALSVCLYSILVPPPLSISVARARASSFGTGFEWTANTRAPNGGGEASNRAETERKTKKNCVQICDASCSNHDHQDSNVFREIKITESVRNGFWEKNIYIYRRWCEKLREISTGESSGYLIHLRCWCTKSHVSRRKRKKWMHEKLKNRRSFW